jgi:hypothetical protein
VLPAVPHLRQQLLELLNVTFGHLHSSQHHKRHEETRHEETRCQHGMLVLLLSRLLRGP